MVQSKEGIVIFQRKQVTYLEKKNMQIDYRPMDSYMDPKLKLMAKQSESFLKPIKI